MLNTQKILYILADLAYLAELLPGKKAHSFEVQSFKQFNGELLKDGKFIQENLERLFNKLEAEEYDVILPDDLFTNTIIDVEKKTEKEVKDYLKEEVIPSLHINSDSHQIQTFILSEYKGSYKVQLSTIQKKTLSPLKAAVEGSEAKLSRIFPLSWAVKSLISLEPSVSVVQLGEYLFMAKHYIGIDQPLVDKVDNLDRFVEAVKTIKGTEPSLQTAYLLTNQSIEEDLKEKLEGVLPLQQLAETDGGDETVPGHLQKAITASMKTISIPDFEIPQFGLKDVEIVEVEAPPSADKAKKTTDEEEDEAAKESADEAKEKEQLPKPNAVGVVSPDDQDEEAAQVVVSQDTLESNDDKEEEKQEKEEKEVVTGEPKEKKEHPEEVKTPEKEKKEEEPQPQAVGVTAETQSAPAKVETVKTVSKQDDQAVVIGTEGDSSDVDLKKFASVSVESEEKINAKPLSNKNKKSEGKKVLKNNDGTGSFVKIFLIGLGSFVLAVVIGAGVGYGLLQLSQPSIEPIEEPQVEWTEPAEELDRVEEIDEVDEREPDEDVLEEVNREEFSIRVVNATTRAGYAGTVASTLEEAGYQTVDAKNAVEDYEPGIYVLMEEESAELISVLSEDLDMELIYLEGVEAEDPRGEFDAVVVLAE